MALGLLARRLRQRWQMRFRVACRIERVRQLVQLHRVLTMKAALTGQSRLLDGAQQQQLKAVQVAQKPRMQRCPRRGKRRRLEPPQPQQQLAARPMPSTQRDELLRTLLQMALMPRQQLLQVRQRK